MVENRGVVHPDSKGRTCGPIQEASCCQFAAAIRKVDPRLKLGGPIFTGQKKDIEVWADAQGRTSWTDRLINYLKAHGRLADLAFFSFEHYPMIHAAISGAVSTMNLRSRG